MAAARASTPLPDNTIVMSVSYCHPLTVYMIMDDTTNAKRKIARAINTLSRLFNLFFISSCLIFQPPYLFLQVRDAMISHGYLFVKKLVVIFEPVGSFDDSVVFLDSVAKNYDIFAHVGLIKFHNSDLLL